MSMKQKKVVTGVPRYIPSSMDTSRTYWCAKEVTHLVMPYMLPPGVTDTSPIPTHVLPLMEKAAVACVVSAFAFVTY